MSVNILNLPNFSNNINSKSVVTVSGTAYPNLAPLAKDTVSFKGHNRNTQKVKKNDFNGFDYAVIEAFKVNISGFKEPEDLNKWINEKIQKDIIHKDYSGRIDEISLARRKTLDEWFNYVTKENSAYTPAMQLMILDFVTKNLGASDDVMPPHLNKGVLADTIHELEKRLATNPKQEISIGKMYKTKLKALYLGSDSNGKPKTNYTGWVVIPSKIHDEKNFSDNVGKLQELSHHNWCTKSLNAEPYLKEGDFHVYLENGVPKIGVRFVGDAIEEIQGQRNNTKIPQIYLEFIQDYIEKNNFDLRETAADEIAEAVDLKDEFNEIKEKIGEEALKKQDAEKIFKAFGFIVKKNRDGKLIINNYRQPSIEYSFEDFGLDENKLISQVYQIVGNADFDGSSLTEIKGVEKIGGDVRLSFSKIQNLGSVKTIGGNLIINDCYLNNLGDLESIGKNVDFDESNVTSLGNLEYIGGDAKFRGSQIESLGHLKEVGRNLLLSGSAVSDIGELERIGKNADCECSLIKSLNHLKYIGGNANFKNSDLEDLGELEYIGKDADFSYTKVRDPGCLNHVGGFIEIDESGLEDEDIEYLIDLDKYRDFYDYDKFADINSMEEFERSLYY